MAIQTFTSPVRYAPQVQTANATVTPMTGFTITIGNKQVELYEAKVYAVRDGAAGPVVGVWAMHCVARISSASGLGEMPSGAAGSTNPTYLSKMFSDATMNAAFVINASNQLTIQVTGLVTTTIDWFAVVDQTVWNST